MLSGVARWGGLAAMIGGALWAVTPLRDVVFGGGETPDHPVFRPYNAVWVLIAALLIVGLVGLYSRHKETYGRLGKAGLILVFGGYALILFGSIPAVFLGADRFDGLIRAGQDLGFLGALVAALGAIFLGINLWRTQAVPRTGALLLIITLPVGLPGIIVIQSIGFVSIAGLAMTVPYGIAWVILGNHLSSIAGESIATGMPGLRKASQ